MKLLSYEDWIKSPHIEDGLTLDKERELRLEIVNFMINFGPYLKLEVETIARGITIFHIYSKQISFKKFDRFLFGAAAIFLAAKLDDCPRGLENSIKSYLYLIKKRKRNNKQDSNNYRQEFDALEFDEFCFELEKKQINDLKEKFCDAEIQLLNFIGFLFLFFFFIKK